MQMATTSAITLAPWACQTDIASFTGQSPPYYLTLPRHAIRLRQSSKTCGEFDVNGIPFTSDPFDPDVCMLATRDLLLGAPPAPYYINGLTSDAQIIVMDEPDEIETHEFDSTTLDLRARVTYSTRLPLESVVFSPYQPTTSVCTSGVTLEYTVKRTSVVQENDTHARVTWFIPGMSCAFAGRQIQTTIPFTTNSVTVLETAVDTGPSLVVIVVPSVLGGLLLIALIAWCIYKYDAERKAAAAPGETKSNAKYRPLTDSSKRW
jgi:hypothetical protein